MADTAIQERVKKQRWAEPGSGHDRIVRWTKIALPCAVGVLIAILMLAPLDKKGDVSFILDKKKVQSVPESMRVEAARYTGTDEKGRQFVMTANRAIQPSSNTPVGRHPRHARQAEPRPGAAADRGQSGPLQYRYAKGRDRRSGKGRRRRRLHPQDQ